MTRTSRKPEAVAFRTENEDGRTVGKAVLHMTAKQLEYFASVEDRDNGMFITPVAREFDVFGRMFWVPVRDRD